MRSPVFQEYNWIFIFVNKFVHLNEHFILVCGYLRRNGRGSGSVIYSFTFKY